MRGRYRSTFGPFRLLPILLPLWLSSFSCLHVTATGAKCTALPQPAFFLKLSAMAPALSGSVTLRLLFLMSVAHLHNCEAYELAGKGSLPRAGRHGSVHIHAPNFGRFLPCCPMCLILYITKGGALYGNRLRLMCFYGYMLTISSALFSWLCGKHEGIALDVASCCLLLHFMLGHTVSRSFPRLSLFPKQVRMRPSPGKLQIFPIVSVNQ